MAQTGTKLTFPLIKVQMIRQAETVLNTSGAACGWHSASREMRERERERERGREREREGGRELVRQEIPGRRHQPIRYLCLLLSLEGRSVSVDLIEAVVGSHAHSFHIYEVCNRGLSEQMVFGLVLSFIKSIPWVRSSISWV